MFALLAQRHWMNTWTDEHMKEFRISSVSKSLEDDKAFMMLK